MMFGDGWNEKTQMPPGVLPLDHQSHVLSLGNGFWAAFTHIEYKRFGQSVSTFFRELAKLWCSFVRPVKAFGYPFNG